MAKEEHEVNLNLSGNISANIPNARSNEARRELALLLALENHKTAQVEYKLKCAEDYYQFLSKTD